MSTLSDIGEMELLRRLTARLPGETTVLQGAGDDCAVVRPFENSEVDWLLTSDAVIEGTHFRAGDDLEHVGWKASGRVLSDLASMGGDPCWALVNISAPPQMKVERVERLFSGIVERASSYGLTVVGGDTTQSEALAVHLFGVGMVPRGAAVLRGGARPGDLLFVTGELGAGRAGRHLVFEPRVREGRFLRGTATSMIDVSDGLASDLRHIVECSNVGAEVILEKLPISEDARDTDAVSALHHALYDGEDFELLFTVPVDEAETMVTRWGKEISTPCSRIGSITSSRGRIDCVNAGGGRSLLKDGGFQHFS